MKQLFVEISKGNFIELDLKEDIPIPIDKSIYDFKDINKKKQDISKKITLPATKTNNKYFKPFIEYGNIQADNNDVYNVNREIVAKVLSNSVELINGSLEFLGTTTVNGVKEYECRIFGGVVDIFELAKRVNIRELGWSEYNHTLTRQQIKDSWGNINGYVYPLIHRRERLGATIWKTQDMIPYVFLYEVLMKLFEFLGIDYNVPILPNNRFKSILFGFGGGDIVSISQAILDTRLVDLEDVSLDTAKVFVNFTNLGESFGRKFFSKFTGFQQLFIDETIVSDDIEQSENYGFKVVYDGVYQLDGELNFNYIFEKGTGLSPTTLPEILELKNVEVEVLVNLDVRHTITVPLPFDSTQANDTDYNYNLTALIDGIVLELDANDQVSFAITAGGFRANTNSNSEYISSIKIETQTGDEGFLTLSSLEKELTDGDTVNIARFLPSMTGDEFLKNIINTFNFVYFQKDETFNMILYNDYYDTSNPIDWTDKIDRSKPIVLDSLSTKIEKEIKNEFAKKDEVDAKFYQDRIGEQYGNNVFINPNNLAKGDKSFKTTWANIVPFFDGDELVYPRFTDDSDNPKKGKARIMMYNGLKPGSWTLRNTINNNFEVLNTYPLVHTFDDVDDPTFDLNFKLPAELYYPTSDIVNVNLFSEYFERYIREITDANARILTASFYLHEQEVKNIDFSKLYVIDNKLFKLNIISGFDADKTSSTKCELIKFIEPDIQEVNVLNTGQIIADPPKETGVTVGSNDDQVDNADESVYVIDGGENNNQNSINIIG